MKLSVIMPVYNEKETIEEILKKIFAVDLSKFGLIKEIIIVDDGSTDGTRDILKKYQSKDETKIIYHEENIGKGMAIRTGLKLIGGMDLRQFGL